MSFISGSGGSVFGPAAPQPIPKAGAQSLAPSFILPAPFTLVNGTPTICGVNVPNDGIEHVAIVTAILVVTTLEVGGQIQAHSLLMATPTATQLFAAAQSPGTFAIAAITNQLAADPGTEITIGQTTALTGGAAVLQSCAIWIF